MKLTYDQRVLQIHLRGANNLKAKAGKVYAISTLVYDKEEKEGLDNSQKSLMQSDEIDAKSQLCYPDSQKPLSVSFNANILNVDHYCVLNCFMVCEPSTSVMVMTLIGSSSLV